MFGIDFEALVLLAILAFILFGPQKLPEYAAKLGALIAKLREATSELSQQAHTSFNNPLQPPADKPAIGESPNLNPPLTQPEPHEAAAVTPPVQPAAAWQAPSPPGATVDCPICRQPVNPDFTFCPQCGQQIKRATPDPYFQIPEATSKDKTAS